MLKSEISLKNEMTSYMPSNFAVSRKRLLYFNDFVHMYSASVGEARDGNVVNNNYTHWVVPIHISSTVYNTESVWHRLGFVYVRLASHGSMNRMRMT